MIQRIQTIYLLLAALIALLCMFIPLGVLPAAGPGEPLNPVMAREHISTLSVGLLMVAIPVLTIFFYSRRPLQLTLCYAALLSCLAFTILAALIMIPRINGVDWTLGSFLPLAYVLALSLAIRGIRQDERLIKSMDRFR